MGIAKEYMKNKTTEILHDSYLNAVVQLPMAQVAAIHNCSPQYVSQVCKGFGLKVDRKQGTVTAPVGVIQQIFWPRPKG